MLKRIVYEQQSRETKMKQYIKEHQVGNLAQCNQVYQLIRLHERYGGYFFSKDSMSFFSSRVHSDVYGGCVFVTSEKNNSAYHEYPRLYTVRYMDSTGNTHTADEFQSFGTRSKAHTFAKNLGEYITATRVRAMTGIQFE